MTASAPGPSPALPGQAPYAGRADAASYRARAGQPRDETGTVCFRCAATCIMVVVRLDAGPPTSLRAWHGSRVVADSAVIAMSVGSSPDQRLVAVLDLSQAPSSRFVLEMDGRPVVDMDLAAIDEDPAVIAPVLGHGGGRAKLLRHLLDTVGEKLGLLGDARFAAAMRTATLASWPAPAQGTAAYALGAGVVAVALPDLPAIGRCRAVRILSTAGVIASPHKPAQIDDGARSDLLLEYGAHQPGPDDLVVLFGDAGTALARLPQHIGNASDLAVALYQDRDDAPARVRGLLAGLKPLLKNDSQLRETGRELARLHASQPARVFSSDRDPVGMGLDLAVPAPCGDVFLTGWRFDPHELLGQLTLVSPTARRRPVAPLWSVPARSLPPRYADQPGFDPTRPYGFVARVGRFSDPFPLMQYDAEVALASGAVSTVRPPAPPTDSRGARDAVLSAIPAVAASPALIADVLAPVVDSLQAAHLDGARVDEQVAIGESPRRPEVSLVIPVYREIAFLRHQLEAFAHDRDLRRCEIVIVLDSPEQREAVVHMLKGLHIAYGVPVRVAVMTRNFGYAPAVNAGARLARGRDLLLLNSDVVPAGPGWLATMRARLRRHRRAGVVGPRLLFEDESLQHAGLYFFRDNVDGLWRNGHYFKGYPADFPAAATARRVPAVTGACMLVRRDLFERLGGLDERYVVGDYEDSDFCLRLAEAGYHALYEPGAELFHFERQSIDDHAGYRDTLAAAYNRWRHHSRWDAAIEALMRRRAFRDPSPQQKATP